MKEREEVDQLILLIKEGKKSPMELVGILTKYDTSSEILELVYKHENAGIRTGVARHLNTPIPILKELSKDPDIFVRYNIYQNPNTPEDLKIDLAINPDIKKFIEANPEKYS